LIVRSIIKPSSRRAAIVVDGEILRISVKSPPKEGRANAEAIELVARAFGVPKSRVELLRGLRSRYKQFRITDPAETPAGLEGAAAARK
jgi:uncharacterized protein (TIGR00251 family)